MKSKGPRLPLVCVPTTAGTGSEATAVGVFSVGATDKKPVVSPLLVPDVALLDAELTLGLPPAVTAATGIDAIVHALEAYTSINPNNSVLSRALSREALALLGRNIRTAVRDGGNLAAREAMLSGALFAGQALAAASVGAVHAIAYPIGCHRHIAHGVTNALMLAPVMRFNMSVCGAAYGELALVIFPDRGAAERRRARALTAAFETLIADLGLPDGCRKSASRAAELPGFAAEAMNKPATTARKIRVWSARWMRWTSSRQALFDRLSLVGLSGGWAVRLAGGPGLPAPAYCERRRRA